MKRLISLFNEMFSSETDGLPGGWYVERNTDLADVPAIRRGDKSVNILSAGNKFLPVIPDTADCRVKFTASITYIAAGSFSIILCFRYDTFTGHGQYVRWLNPAGTDELIVEYGTTRLNIFTPVETRKFRSDTEAFKVPMNFEIDLRGTALSVIFSGGETKFKAAKGKGKIAIARDHFWDVLRLTSFTIEGEPPENCAKPVSFTVPLPDSLTCDPIFCDVTLQDYGNCMDAELAFHGGVAETPTGEGNYHEKRVDMLTRPYLKILTPSAIEKHIVYDKTVVQIQKHKVVPQTMYLVYEKIDWPFRRTVRFIKPSGKFDFAVGCENYYHNTLPDLELSPAETVFSMHGEVLYSGQGITDPGDYSIQFLSQPDKLIVKKLPKDNPYYRSAVKFARANHYFFDREQADFRIVLTASDALPVDYQVILEDAFLQKIRNLRYTRRDTVVNIGVRRVNRVELTVEPLKDLACGVYHLRVRSIDPSTALREDYCPFEFMCRKKGSLPAPQLSGLPFIYDSRTETRGLMTDAFDPFHPSQMNLGHYISCANFLAAAARKFQVYSTVRAYGRQNFLWIGSRCQDDWSLETNMDLIRETDYVRIEYEHIPCQNLTWTYTYKDIRLKMLIDFLKTRNDPEFDLAELRKIWKKGETIPVDILRHAMEKYWEEWQDYVNDAVSVIVHDLFRKLRKENPRLRLSQYGPFHIYSGRLKGPECVRMRCNSGWTADITGFWQYEDYPFSAGYRIERGLYTLTSCLLALPGSAIYPEIYAGSKFQSVCPDGAVFFAHPIGSPERPRSEKMFTRQIANFVYASGHLTDDGFHYWTRRGFQLMRGTRRWYEAMLKIWSCVVDHPAERPLRCAAYVSSDASRRADRRVITELRGDDGPILDIRKTSSEDVPFIYESAAENSICAGFQLLDKTIPKLEPEQVDTLVLPPLKGMAPEIILKIRELHKAGVNLIACENVEGMEDVFGVRDTGVMKRISNVVPTGNFCRGGSEFCDDELCQGSYAAAGAKILLRAEIPVLTIKRNAKASAAFFNVPPHLVKAERFRQRAAYGRDSISILIRQAIGELMRAFSRTGISVSGGRLIACHTADKSVLVIVSNPNDYSSLTVEVSIEKRLGLPRMPEASREIVLLREDKNSRTYRVFLPAGELAVLRFPENRKR